MERLELRTTGLGRSALQLRIQLVERALSLYFASDRSVLDAEDVAQFRAQMMRHDEEEKASDAGDSGVVVDPLAAHQVLVGVSSAPYVHQLTLLLCQWHNSGTNPLTVALGGHPTEDEAEVAVVGTTAIEGVTADSSSRERVLGVSTQCVAAFITAIAADDGVRDDTCVAAASTIVGHLGGARGLLTLLGFQQTVGSRTLAPLTRQQCIDAFSKPHTAGEKLTVGARALSKHCVRSSSGWWGELKGNDATKNARAQRKLCELLTTATWKNVHSLPHAHATMELRNALGYGARWDAETRAFRGFLEPPMADGHEVRWRH